MRGVLFVVCVLSAGAASAQSQVIYDDVVENGYSLSQFDANVTASFDGTLCHSGSSCLMASYNSYNGYVELSKPGFDVLAYGWVGVWLRAEPAAVETTFQLSWQGVPVGAPFLYEVNSDWNLVFIDISGFAAPVADGIHISSAPVDGGALFIDDVYLSPADDGGTGGGEGGGGGGDTGFGGGGSMTPPATGGGAIWACQLSGGCATGGHGYPYGGGSGQFGGGADLGCNCDATTPMSNVMTALFGVMASMQLRRRRR